MDHHYIAVLEYLAPHGIGNYTNISELLNEMYPIDSKTNRLLVSSQSSKALSLLNALEGHVIFQNGQAKYFSLGWSQQWEEEERFRWFDTYMIHAHITPDGLQFINQLKSERQNHAVSRSVIETNEATTLLYKRQNRLYYVTLAIAVLSVLFPALAFFRDEKVGELHSTITSQQQVLARTRVEVQRLQKSYDSLYKVYNLVNKRKR